MTFQVTVQDTSGKPVAFAIVTGTVEATGQSFTRGTDGNGYADLAIFAVPAGQVVTLTVQSPLYQNHIQYPVTGPPTTNQPLTIVLESVRPFEPAPREYHGQMCGIRVAGLPSITGNPDPTLVMTWLLPFYSRDVQTRIVEQYVGQGYVDFLLDWAYARSVGYSVAAFVDLCVWLRGKGCRPVPMLCSKDYDPHHDVPGILANITPLVQPLIDSHAVSRVGVGFELGIDNWLTAKEVQDLIDGVTAMLNPSGIRCYAHFQPGYPSFQQHGDTAVFWQENVGKLAGLFAQTKPESDIPATCDWVNDCLERCAGNDGWPTVLIDGHGVDFIALEVTASRQFAGTMTEAQGNAYARAVVNVPPRTGPAGTAKVMGSGNGM